MRVRIYRNLNTGTLSMQHKTPKGWRVCAHPAAVQLSDARFVVREAGRQRVLREKRKNVHAWIEGELLPRHLWADRAGTVLNRVAKYNPYTCGHWYLQDSAFTPITSADMVYIRARSGGGSVFVS